MFPNAYVTIERLLNTGSTSLGSQKTTPTKIIENLKVCLLEDTGYKLKNTINFGESGQATLTMFSLSCNTFFDIQEKDTIIFNGVIGTAGTSLEVGDKLQVMNHPYVGNLLPHIKATLKLGVK